MDNICRVCRSTSETEPLYHPCKCSGSMKFIHQSCLEEWLKVSKKQQCDICHFKYHFRPVYSENAPERLGIVDMALIITKRSIENFLWHCRVLVALFAWVIWVPYVTSWTWRLYLNPSGMFEQQPSNSPSKSPFYTLAFKEYFELKDGYLIRFMEWIEMFTDWKSLAKRFLADVFEGQIIAAVVIILGLCLLLLREYIVHLIQQENLVEQAARGRRRPAPMMAPRPANRPPRPPRTEQQLLNDLARQNEQARALQERVQGRQREVADLEEYRDAQEREIAALEVVRDDRERGILALQEYRNERQQAALELAAHNAQLEQDLLKLEESIDRHQNRALPLTTAEPMQPEEAAEKLREARRKEKGKMPLKQESNLQSSSAEQSSSKGLKLDTKGATHASEPSPRSDQLSPALEHLRYNLRSRRNSQDLTLQDYFGVQPASLKKEPVEKQGSRDSRSDKEIKAQIVNDLRDLDTGSDSSQGRGRETESDSDIDVRLHDVARLMRNRLERERVRELVPDPEPEPVQEPIRERVQQRQPVQQPAVEPLREPVAPEGPPQNARVNINVDIDDDGEIVAQIEVNDFQGFMDLVGLNGPITKLLQNVALVHLLVFVVLGVGVWVPFMLGSVTNYFVLTILMPALEFMFTKSIGTIQKITDPVVEPVVDFLLVALNVSSSSNTTVSASVNNGTAVSYLNTLYKLFGIPTSAKNATSGVPFGPYHPNFFQSFQEDLLSVILGYSTITIFFLVYLNYSTMNNNGYVGNLARVVHAIQTNIGIGIKLFVYLVLEIVLFPFFSACLIDLVTLPLFSTTVASRYQFYEKFPTMFLCLHWVIGTVFMYYFAQYIAFLRGILRKGVLWFLKDPQDPNFNAFREIINRTMFAQARKMFYAVIIYGTAILASIGGPVQLIIFFDKIVSYFYSKPTMLQVFPLRLEYHDSISEIPFDLFFFQFAFPQLYSWFDPAPKFEKFARIWFGYFSRKLRMSHFLMGQQRPEEESDYEDDEEIMPTSPSMLRMAVPKREAAQDSEDSDWVDETPVQAAKPKIKKREKRFARVPNHDNIEVVPGKMMEWIDDGPIVGRPNETPQDVEHNWTKVYTPPRFFPRIYALISFQLLSFCLGIFMLLLLPILTGRFFFSQWEKITTIHVISPKEYQNPILPKRPELPIHDFYSYFAGLCISALVYHLVSFTYGLFKSSDLQRRNSIRRSRNRRNADNEDDGWVEVVADVPVSLKEKLATFYQRHIQLRLTKTLKFMYLVSFAGLLCPLLIGLCLDFYLLSPIHMSLGRRQVVFVVLDWCSGVMIMRIFYNISLLLPNRRVGQIVAQARDADLFHMDLVNLNRYIFFPIVTCFGGMLSIPYFARVFELLNGIFDSQGLEDGLLVDFCFELAPGLAIMITAGAYLAQKGFKSLIEWMDRLKDDQYLVGQALQNVDT